METLDRAGCHAGNKNDNRADVGRVLLALGVLALASLLDEPRPHETPYSPPNAAVAR
jgi:hypothetical protein